MHILGTGTLTYDNQAQQGYTLKKPYVNATIWRSWHLETPGTDLSLLQELLLGPTTGSEWPAKILELGLSSKQFSGLLATF